METFSSLLTVAVVSLLAAISPGPDFVIVVRNSLSYSRKTGLLTACGVCLALLIHLTYTMIGLGILITEDSWVYHLLKYAGAGYLFYLGCKSLLSSFKGQKSFELCYSDDAILMPSKAIKQGFLTNLLNPKCALFLVSFFSQFIDTYTPTSLKISMAFVNWIINLGWFLLLCYLITGSFLLSYVNNFKAYVDRVMGFLLILVSLKLVI